MLQRLSRRSILRSALYVSTLALAEQAHARSIPDEPSLALAQIEKLAGGRLGVCILDADSGNLVGHRLDERFGMCSTFKVLLAAVILREAELGNLSLSDVVPFNEDDMIFHAPVTSQNLQNGGMEIGELAKAAQLTSDNVAANLLLKLVGGPIGFTEKLRAIGDETTRLDRTELSLNFVLPGDVRDTTTPHAMAKSLSQYLLGSALGQNSQDVLASWMRATENGAKRIRAGLHPDWVAGSKTGTFFAEPINNKCNDVAVIWPPNGSPVIVSAFYEAPGHFPMVRDEDQQVLADVGRVAATWMTG